MQLHRSIQGCWIALLATTWLSYQQLNYRLHVSSARNPGNPVSSNKARSTTTQSRDHSSSSTHSSSKASRIGNLSSEKKRVQAHEKLSKSKLRKPASVLKKSRRGRASFDEEDTSSHAETSNDLEEEYDPQEEIDLYEAEEVEDDADDQDEVVYNADDEDGDGDGHSRETLRRKHTDKRGVSRTNQSTHKYRGRSSSSSFKSSSQSSSRRVVPYARSQPNPATLAFTRGIAALRESIPDAAALRDTALSTLNAAKENTGVITANLYREVKGLTSSELEQVMLKATRPDDSPVKGKHVERLVGVTYQISARYDIYDAVLRKLWSKMCEKDWRTTIKALYVLHRFSADGAPDHQPSLKARLRELRRTKDPKRKEKYFNSKQLLSCDSSVCSLLMFLQLVNFIAYVLLLGSFCFS